MPKFDFNMLAQNAPTVGPPLGMLRDFVTESDEQGKAFIDLKKFGARLFVDAFRYIQLLRLRHQHPEAGQGRPGDNRIFIGRLNQLDRRILKEAFRQAKSLQQRIKLNYQL